MNKIIVTGSAGFIGFSLSKKLLERGDNIIGIDNHNDYYDPKIKEARLSRLEEYPNYHHTRFDISNKKDLGELFKSYKPIKVVNLAAQAGVRYSIENPNAYIKSNIVGFGNILENCRQYKIQHLVYASTSSVYGANTKMPFSEQDSVNHPLSVYAATKKSNELMAHTYSYLFKLPTTGLRFFTVYGPYGRPDMALFKFTKLISESKKIPLFNKGDHVRDFTYIDDIVEGIVLLIKKPPRKKIPFEIYNLGSGNPKSLKFFLKNIEKNLNKKAALNLKAMQVGDVHKTHADIKKINKAYSYQPKFDIPTGVKNFVNWYKKYFKE